MNFRQIEITTALTEWLDRYSCPSNLRDKPKAAQAEAEALAAVLLRYAPSSEYQPFLNRVFSKLDYQLKTRAWPTVSEIATVCDNTRNDAARGGQMLQDGGGKDMRPCAIAARCMNEGKPVAEGWLYGRNAVEMIAESLIDQDTMTRYRSSAFLRRKDLYGEGPALAWEAEAKQCHEDAKQIHGQNREARRGIQIPTNRALEGFAA